MVAGWAAWEAVSRYCPQKQAQACLQSGLPGASHPPRTGSKEGLPSVCMCLLCPLPPSGYVPPAQGSGTPWLKIRRLADL